MEEDKVPALDLLQAMSTHKCDKKQEFFAARLDFAPLQVFSGGLQGHKLVCDSGAKLILKHLKNKKGHGGSKKDKAREDCEENRPKHNRSPEGKKCTIPHVNDLLTKNVQFVNVNGVSHLTLDVRLWLTNEQTHALAHCA